jgi:hypothetical protein
MEYVGYICERLLCWRKSKNIKDSGSGLRYIRNSTRRDIFGTEWVSP